MDLRTAINNHAIFRCPPGFALKGIPEGTSYSWQFYPRRILTIPSAMQIIASVMLGEINDIQNQIGGPIQVGAMESAGPLMLGAILAMSKNPNVSYFVIRKERKKYGLLNQIEGMIYRDTPIVLIDDISNSKNTLYLARNICESEAPGSYVINAITLINKGSGADEISSLPVRSIFTSDEFDLTWSEFFKDIRSPAVMDLAVNIVLAHKTKLWYSTNETTLVPAQYAIDETMKHGLSEDQAIHFLINKFIEERMT